MALIIKISVSDKDEDKLREAYNIGALKEIFGITDMKLEDEEFNPDNIDEKYPVVFRVGDSSLGNEVMALFPTIKADFNGNIMSYVHVGQHGAANYDHCIKHSRKAREDEYKPLLDELLSIGYNLKIVQRAPRK